ncbi:hypothetical protein ACH5RR_023581 [Cinchona calisaya]|uniref:Uncharacterized protein n=1 Tax=Cinchona calisaya TaxID=153742 RepID=A0ABD2ZC60_9GENT
MDSPTMSSLATTLLQFKSLEPVQVCLDMERSRDKCERNFDPNAQEEGEWILVTKRKERTTGFFREDQVESVNMTSSIEIEDNDATEDVEILAKPTKDNGSFVELDLSSLESIIHSLFELSQEARHLLVDVLQECDGRDSTF